jgi:hypothetical protein
MTRSAPAKGTKMNKKLKPIPAGKKGKGLRQLPKSARRKIGFMKAGGNTEKAVSQRKKKPVNYEDFMVMGSKGTMVLDEKAYQKAIDKRDSNFKKSKKSKKSFNMKAMKTGGLTKAQEKKLKKHSKHHSAKHMSAMKKDMKAGKSFNQAHNKAMKKVGK